MLKQYSDMEKQINKQLDKYSNGYAEEAKEEKLAG